MKILYNMARGYMQTYFKEIKKSLAMFKDNFTQAIIFELIFNAISLGIIYLLNKYDVLYKY